MTTAPEISVVMSVYNGKPYLNEAIKSVVKQTFEDFEFIIINDGSSDGSAEILQSWSARDSRIAIINQTNQGLTPSLNRGIRLARGRFIARLDADDVALPTRFEKQVAYLNEHPSVGVLGTNIEQIDADGDHQFSSDLPTDPGHIAWLLLFTCPLYHPTVMMRKQLVLQVGGYDPSIQKSQDYDLWTRLTRTTDFANLLDVGLKYRWWGGNVSIAQENAQIADAVTSAARLHTHYLQHRDHPGRQVARFFFDGHGKSYSAEQLSSYFDHILNLYRAFTFDRRFDERTLHSIRLDLTSKLERFAQITREKSLPRSLWMYARLLPYMPNALRTVLHRSRRAVLNST